MTTNVAQAITLTAYGNDYLRTGHIPLSFRAKNTTFQFCNRIDFKEHKKQTLFSSYAEHIVASDPVAWFEYLKNGRCKHLRLYFEPSQEKTDMKDYQLVGGEWLIEAVYEHGSHDWTNRWEVTDLNAADKRIWSATYIRTAKRQPTRNLQLDLRKIGAELKQTLTEISDFAFKQNLPEWGRKFDNARKTLDSSSPEEDCYYKDLVPLDNYSLAAKQVLFSADSAWVFGGMGWWNDMGDFNDDEYNEAYDKLSERLYANINKSIVAAINTF